jgi:putative FmdB family regulatory protein
MPIYEYECEVCQQTTEQFRSMADRYSDASCDACGGLAKRVLSPTPSISDSTHIGDPGMASRQTESSSPTTAGAGGTAIYAEGAHNCVIADGVVKNSGTGVRIKDSSIDVNRVQFESVRTPFRVDD